MSVKTVDFNFDHTKKVLKEYSNTLRNKGFEVLAIMVEDLETQTPIAVVLPSVKDIIKGTPLRVEIKSFSRPIIVQDITYFCSLVDSDYSGFIEILNRKHRLGEKSFFELIDSVVDIPVNSSELEAFDELANYIGLKWTGSLFKASKNHAMRQVRTFNNNISKKDLEDFPILEDYKGTDFQYWVYSFLVIDEK